MFFFTMLFVGFTEFLGFVEVFLNKRLAECTGFAECGRVGTRQNSPIYRSSGRDVVCSV